MGNTKQIEKILLAYQKGSSDKINKKPYNNPFKKKDFQKAYKKAYNEN